MTPEVVIQPGKQVAREQARADIRVATMDFYKSLGTDAKDIITELIRTASNNPLMGVALAIITADVLGRAQIIDQGTAQLIQGVAVTAFGVSVAGEVVQDVTNPLSKIFGGGSSASADPAELIKPVAATLVQPSQPNSQKALGSGTTDPSQSAGMLATLLKSVPAEPAA